jgi:antibiotic biosynthesis monooxygenase (ABM) superfamily enzyme
MIVYEVNLTVDHAIADDYAAWLGDHVREMLTLPGFVSAEWLSDVDYHEQDGADPRWTVQYRLESHDDLTRYVEQHAERMRADGLERFGTQFKATRRILRVRDGFEHEAQRAS